MVKGRYPSMSNDTILQYLEALRQEFVSSLPERLQNLEAGFFEVERNSYAPLRISKNCHFSFLGRQNLRNLMRVWHRSSILKGQQTSPTSF